MSQLVTDGQKTYRLHNLGDPEVRVKSQDISHTLGREDKPKEDPAPTKDPHGLK